VNDELVNRSSAIWALPKSQVTDEQHTEFFRRITGFDAQTPLMRVHMSVDAPVQFHALLYVPEKAPLDLFSKDRRGLRLYAKRVGRADGVRGRTRARLDLSRVLENEGAVVFEVHFLERKRLRGSHSLRRLMTHGNQFRFRDRKARLHRAL